MPRTIINTVGTSLLSNAARAAGESPDQWQDADKLLGFLKSNDLVRASAETNALSRLLGEDDALLFLHSHTPQGEVCARALVAYFRARGIDAALHAIDGLEYSEKKFKTRGLRSLVATLCHLIARERAQDRSVAINATGGFKGEISYATVVALLFDVPLYYIHEAFGDIVEMPPVPVAWDYSLVAWNQEFFEWLEADLRLTSEVEARLHSVSPQVRLLLRDEDGYMVLSPAGEAFFSAFQTLLREAPPQKVQLSAMARRQLDELSPSHRAEMVQLLHKLSVDGLRAMCSHWIKPSSDCLSFPTGHNANRALFFEDEGRVCVCELLSHYDGGYERAYARGIWRKNYGEFAPWQGV